MANHVNSRIEFVEINAAALKKLGDLFSRLQEGRDNQGYLSDLFVDGEDVTFEQSRTKPWSAENIGTEWCYVDDSDLHSEHPYVVTISAWYPPTKGLQKLLELVAPEDPQMVTAMIYEDERPNFAGWVIFVGASLEDEDENTWDEFRELLFEKHPELIDGWDEDEEEWRADEIGDEKRDEFEDLLGEFVFEWQMQDVDYCLASLKED